MNDKKAIYLTECPRDAMQGIHAFIPTSTKIEYLNALLNVGFDRLDFGSFVSPKAIPQLADTKEVLKELVPSPTKLLAIVGNIRGVEEACALERIDYIGFPFSVSPTFQLRNTNQTLDEAFLIVENALERCKTANKKLVVYLSMGFGNPYGDEYSESILTYWTEKLIEAGVTELMLSDTVGVSNEENILNKFSIYKKYNAIEIGLHLHSNPLTAKSKIEAALKAGCVRFDSAMLGFGGCPMAADDLTGNIDTKTLLDVLKKNAISCEINSIQLKKAEKLALSLFSQYH